jgi:hypothetical protein
MSETQLCASSYRYVFDETSGSSSENIKIWLTEHILIKSLKYDTITLRDLKRSSVKVFKKLGITKDLDKSGTHRFWFYSMIFSESRLTLLVFSKLAHRVVYKT